LTSGHRISTVFNGQNHLNKIVESKVLDEYYNTYHTKCTKKCGLRTNCNAVLKELGPKNLNWIVARSSHIKLRLAFEMAFD
jgi:hypothetical protein